MWDSRLWHGTHKNLSNKSRWSIIATMGMWWVMPSMDIIRSIDTENKNVLLLTEEWSSMDDWDKYIAKRESGEEDDNFLKKIENLLTNKGHEITFSEITN